MPLSLPITLKTAKLSPDSLYRWELTRTWDRKLPSILWVMLNPSIADHTRDDPTMRVVVGRSKLLGYGKCIVVNLFSYRATHPKELLNSIDTGQPLSYLVGQHTDKVIIKHAERVQYIMIAWGTQGALGGRNREVLELLAPYSRKVHYLGLTKNYQPRHPLRVAYDVKPLPWGEIVRYSTQTFAGEYDELV